MATVAEVELMNRGFDRLGETLLRSRMLEEQKRERELGRTERRSERAEDQGLRQTERAEDQAQRAKQFGLEERRVVASEKSAAASDDMRKLLLEDRKTQQAISQVREQINDVTARHRAGQLSTAAANAHIARIKTGIEQGTTLILKESGLADFALQDLPKKEAGEFNTAPIANAKRLGELRSAIVDAQASRDPARIAAAEQALEDFQTLARAGGETDSVTEYERNPETGDLTRTRTRREKPTADGITGTPQDQAKKLSLELAQKFLAQAGGDKNKARELARKAGYKF